MDRVLGTIGPPGKDCSWQNTGAAKNGTLLQTLELAYVLSRWRDWGGERGPREWVRRITKSDEGFVSFMTKMLSEVTHESGDRVWRTPRLDPDLLARFLDVRTAYKRAQTLLQGANLDVDQRTALQTIISAFEKT